MKAKKALKRLTRVETLLSTVIDQYAASEHRVRELLDTARALIVRAKETVALQVSPRPAKKPPVRADEPKRRNLTAEGRKRISLAAKERWAAAKRKSLIREAHRRVPGENSPCRQ